MNKNILLVNLSVVDPKKINEEYTYRYKDGEQYFECKGIQTNEAVTKLLLSQINKKAEKLDCIYLIVSEAVEKEISATFSDGKKRTHKEFYLEQIEKYCVVNNLTDVWNREHIIEFSIKDAPDNMALMRSSIQITEQLYDLKQKLQNEEGDVHLYIDSNGGLRDFMTVLLGTIQLLKLRDFYVHSIWGVYFGPDKKIIVNKTKAYKIFDLISGIDEYTGYGRAKRLNQFFLQSEICHDQGILEVINSLAEHIQLCHPAKIQKELEQLKKLSYKYINSNKVTDENYAFWNFVLKEILKDYGALILDCREPRELKDIVFKKNCATVLELIQWCIRKDFLQQALTLFESKMPSMLVGEKDKDETPVVIDPDIRNDIEKRYKFCFEKNGKKQEKRLVKGKDWSYIFLTHYLNDNGDGVKKYWEKEADRVRYLSYNGKETHKLEELISKNPLNPIYSNCERKELKGILRLYRSIKAERNGINHASNKNGHSNEPMNKAEMEELLKEAVTRLKKIGVK